MDSELSYSPKLPVAFKLMLENPAISSSPERSSFKFVQAARFLKNQAPHLFQVREMGAKLENRMDRWLWDLLEQSEKERDHPALSQGYP
jgi:hypothetical protein